MADIVHTFQCQKHGEFRIRVPGHATHPPMYSYCAKCVIETGRQDAHRKDRNHDEVVELLVRGGCEVLNLCGVGGGCPDLLVYKNQRFALVEVKAGSARIRPKQAEFQQRFPVHVVRCPEHVQRLLEQFRSNTSGLDTQ